MKKRVYLLLVGMLTVSACFAGCGKSDKQETTATETTSVEASEKEEAVVETTNETVTEIVETVVNETEEKTTIKVEGDLANEPYVEPIKNFLDGSFKPDSRQTFSAFPQEAVEAFFLEDSEMTYDAFIAAMDAALTSTATTGVEYSFVSAEPIDETGLEAYAEYMKKYMSDTVVTEGYTVAVVSKDVNSPTRVYKVNDAWTLDFTYVTGESLK